MQWKHLGTLVIFAGTALAGGARADAVSQQFGFMDTNRDGRLSAEEHAAGARRMFEAMDTDRDGRVTAAEMDYAQGRQQGAKVEGPSSQDKIKAIDANGDGVLSAAEHEAGARAMFAKMDVNNDGFLTEQEMRDGHKRLMPKA